MVVVDCDNGLFVEAITVGFVVGLEVMGLLVDETNVGFEVA